MLDGVEAVAVFVDGVARDFRAYTSRRRRADADARGRARAAHIAGDAVSPVGTGSVFVAEGKAMACRQADTQAHGQQPSKQEPMHYHGTVTPADAPVVLTLKDGCMRRSSRMSAAM